MYRGLRDNGAAGDVKRYVGNEVLGKGTAHRELSGILESSAQEERKIQTAWSDLSEELLWAVQPAC